MNKRTAKSQKKGGYLIEVDFYGNDLEPMTRVAVRTIADALVLVVRELKRAGEIYNATIFGSPDVRDVYYGKEKIFRNYYFNGVRIVELNEPWYLSREQARNLDVVDGRIIGIPEVFERKEV